MVSLKFPDKEHACCSITITPSYQDADALLCFNNKVIIICLQCTVLCCRQCDQLIANKKDVFSMSLEGPMGAYVNPGGHVHEMMTVFKAQGIQEYGRASTENSWFPG